MARKKVKLAWIANDTARKASLKKRRASLLKKVKELSTLCGVRTAIILYSPGVAEPAVWPTEPEVVRSMVGDFLGMPELERGKRRLDQESYIKDRLARAQAQLCKLQRKSKEMEVGNVMHQVLAQARAVESLSRRELAAVDFWARDKSKEIEKRSVFSRRQDKFRPASPVLVHSPPKSQALLHSHQPPMAAEVATAAGGLAVEQAMWDEWFADMINAAPMAIAAMGGESNDNDNNDVGGGGVSSEIGASKMLQYQRQLRPPGNTGMHVPFDEMLGPPPTTFDSRTKSAWPNFFSP